MAQEKDLVPVVFDTYLDEEQEHVCILIGEEVIYFDRREVKVFADLLLYLRQELINADRRRRYRQKKMVKEAERLCETV